MPITSGEVKSGMTKTRRAVLDVPAGRGKCSMEKPKAQMHRRSRSGCYTCRLRRKKCDESNPSCSACRNLGLDCEYKRPMWWSDNERRRKHKEDIKMIIKQKKMSEKALRPRAVTPSRDSPPELSHSVPNSVSHSIRHSRSHSMDSILSSNDTALEIYPVIAEPALESCLPSSLSQHETICPIYSSSRNLDDKLNALAYIDDNSSLDRVFLEGDGIASHYDPASNLLTYMTCLPTQETYQYALDLSEGDRRMLDHFVDFVVPTLYPVLEETHHGSQMNLIMPALQTNPSFVHCCLSIAAQHFKTTLHTSSAELDDEIMRHRYATIHSLCDALAEDVDHAAILEATLGMINFQCGVGPAFDDLPDVPWHQHFSAAVSLVQKLDLPKLMLEDNTVFEGTPFSMTLTAHVDILGATMLGQAPAFAHMYREKHLSNINTSLGLRELMGCDDKVLYLISEISCLEALKRDGMDDVQLCSHVTSLGGQIGLTETGDSGPKIPFNGRGIMNTEQLGKNITAAFRLAARIYLCSLVPGFQVSSDSCTNLLDRLAQTLEFIPSGLGGFDKSMTWVYLIGGAVSMFGSKFRLLFQERVALLDGYGTVGSFGKLGLLLDKVWQRLDDNVDAPYISWRDTMQLNDWDFLLI